MPKLTGPLFSMEAKGPLGGGIVYQGGPSGPRVGKKLVRRDKRTSGQLSHRALFQAAVAYWAGLSWWRKARYEVRAEGLGMTGQNLCVKEYLLFGPPPPVSLYHDAVMALGPAGYWRMGEAAGNLADSSGNGNTAVKHGAPGYGVAGAIAYDSDTAVSLWENNADYFEVANSESVDTGDVFSVVGWFKKLADGVQEIGISRGANGYAFGVSVSNKLTLVKSGVGLVVSSTVVITGTAWHMVAVTKGGADVHLYIDEADVTGEVGDLEIIATGGVIQIGRAALDGLSPFVGSLDEIAVFPTALSAGDILALWESREE